LGLPPIAFQCKKQWIDTNVLIREKIEEVIVCTLCLFPIEKRPISSVMQQRSGMSKRCPPVGPALATSLL
jgi:hypothetical protein